MISIIVACSKNRVIGNKGQIPWSLKEDLRHFKELTTGNVLIMGRKTFEGIGRPLPNRYTIVISGTKRFDFPDCMTVPSFEEAICAAKKIVGETLEGISGADGDSSHEVQVPADNAIHVFGQKNCLGKNPFFGKNIFICGGQQVYEKAIGISEKMYVTEIDAVFEGDAFFPEFDRNQFVCISSEKMNCNVLNQECSYQKEDCSGVNKHASETQNADFTFSFVEYERK